MSDDELKVSDVMSRALDDLDSATLEFEIEDMAVKRIKGKWIFQMRPANDE